MKSIKLLSLGLLLAFLTSTATAVPVGGLGNTDSCTYDGTTYSEGSRVDQAGKTMKCSSGEWVAAKIRHGRVIRPNAPRTAGRLAR